MPKLVVKICQFLAEINYNNHGYTCSIIIPYRTKIFIGINVREICNCKNSEKLKPTKNPTCAYCLKTTLKNDKNVYMVAPTEVQISGHLSTGT